MPWQDRMGPATFRGVPFFIAQAELMGGRRTVTHEYPLRDVPFVEDLGRRARRLPVEGYVIGPEYFTSRDALIAALEEQGPGSLVHPYFGTRTVACSGYSVRSSAEEGGIARFAIDFEETESKAFAPSVLAAPGAAAGLSSERALTSVSKRFPGIYLPTSPPIPPSTVGRSLPAFSFTSIVGILHGAGAAITKHLTPVITSTQALASLRRMVDTLSTDATSLVRTPVSLATRLGEVFRSLLSMPSTARLGVDALLRVYDFTPNVQRPDALTPTRATEQQNYDATLHLVRSMVAIQAAQFAVAAATVAEGGYDSYDDAIAVRDAVIALLDAEAAATTDDEVYGDLQELRTDVAAAVPGETRDLPQLVTVTPPVSVPSVVLAYQLYGSLALEADLLARNRIRHPGFVPGGRELQVLGHA
jgi:prophage DNA circulation protein